MVHNKTLSIYLYHHNHFIDSNIKFDLLVDNHLDMDEYNRAFNMLHYQMSIVAAAKPKMAAMVYAADANGDDMLTKDEFMAILKGSDANGKYWCYLFLVD